MTLAPMVEFHLIQENGSFHLE